MLNGKNIREEAECVGLYREHYRLRIKEDKNFKFEYSEITFENIYRLQKEVLSFDEIKVQSYMLR